MLLRQFTVGLGLLSCLLIAGCAHDWHRRQCTTRPAVVNTVPIGQPPCNGCAPGAAVPGAPAPVPPGGSVVPPPAPVPPGQTFSAPPAGGTVVVPRY